MESVANYTDAKSQKFSIGCTHLRHTAQLPQFAQPQILPGRCCGADGRTSTRSRVARSQHSDRPAEVARCEDPGRSQSPSRLPEGLLLERCRKSPLARCHSASPCKFKSKNTNGRTDGRTDTDGRTRTDTHIYVQRSKIQMHLSAPINSNNFKILKFLNNFLCLFYFASKNLLAIKFSSVRAKENSTANSFVETFYNQRKSPINWKLKTRIKWT